MNFALTPISSNWWHKDLMTRYRLIKKIPSAFFEKNSEMEVKKLFPEDYFEWQEIKPAS